MFDPSYLRKVEAELAAWDNRYRALRAEQEQGKRFETESGIPVKPIYTPLDLAGKQFDYLDHLGFPGDPPYTRGAFPNMYREKPWRFTQYSGRSTAEASPTTGAAPACRSPRRGGGRPCPTRSTRRR